MVLDNYILYPSSKAEPVLRELDDLERETAKEKDPRKKHYQLEGLAITCMKLSALYDLTTEQEDKLREKRESYGSQISKIERKLIEEARQKHHDPFVTINFDFLYRITQDPEAIRANAILLSRAWREELGKNPSPF